MNDERGAEPQRLEQHQRRCRRFLVHLGLSVFVGAFFVTIWALLATEPNEAATDSGRAGFWPGWIMLLLVVPLAVHGLIVLARSPPPEQVGRSGLRRGASQPITPGGGGRVLATVLFTDIAS
jgi:hypothetical protein